MRHLALAVLLIAIGCEDGTNSSGDGGGVATNARPSPGIPRALALVRDRRVAEVSGIVPAPGVPEHYWVHNDSGDKSRLYLLDPRGEVRLVLHVRGADSDDWEDISLGPAPAGDLPWLYIADTGNNKGGRRVLTLYRVAPPSLDGVPFGATVKSAKADRLEFSYPGLARDCEAMAVHPESGDVYLFTKHPLDCEVFRIRSPAWNGRAVTAELVARIRPGFHVTAADIHPGGRRFLLRTYVQVLEYAATGDSDILTAFSAPPLRGLQRWLEEFQGESVCYVDEGRAFVTLSEGTPARIYRTELPAD